ncbi:MAG: GH92 family glycosyl hydrolase [Draconibacterium sp.]
MKKSYPVLLVLLVSIFLSCSKQPEKNLIKYVDLMIGTQSSTLKTIKPREGSKENHGQVIPAVTAPFGMTQWTPQTQETEIKCIAPFYSDAEKSQGFRGTHWLDGSCTQDYGTFTLFPTNFTETMKLTPKERAVPYIFNAELSTPAFSTTYFPDSKITTEITATKRSGFFRFEWQTAENPAVIIDVNNDEGEGFIAIDVENQEIFGYNPVRRIYNGNGKPAGISGFFVAKFNVPFAQFGTFAGENFAPNNREEKNKNQLGAMVVFKENTSSPVLVKIGTSFTSIENARKNLEAEISDWNFENTKTKLEDTWNQLLGSILIEGGSVEDKVKFYTAMYRSLFHPRLFSDANGDYVGFADDTQIHNSTSFDYYDDFSNWDIFRAQMPLLSLIAPKEYNNMVKSLVAKAEQGGWLPIFPMWDNYTSAMIGDHSSSIICDAAMKGFDLDLEKAYFYMHKNAFETPENQEDYIDGKGRRSLTSYLQYGYVPIEDDVLYAFHKREQVSRTLEYAYDDWAVAQVAKKLGKTDDYNALMKRSQNYRNVFDASKGWVCGRSVDGSFTSEFEATKQMFYITEGTPKHYTFYVPHDVDGLIELMGGKEKFNLELNLLIDNKEYWHGNEPSHQIPYFFNYVDDWAKTQSTVKHILESEYGTGPGGLAGNEDAGQMSAWYVFSAMGFYPTCPGSNEYQLSSPVFDKVTLTLDTQYYPGRTFVLDTEPGNNYGTFNAVKLNESVIEPVITHEDIQKGGILKFSNTK